MQAHEGLGVEFRHPEGEAGLEAVGHVGQHAPENAQGLAREREGVEKIVRRRHREVEEDRAEENEHLKIQHMLTTVGRSLGYAVHVATNDRGRTYEGQCLASLTVERLPDLGLADETAQTIALIDVLWIRPETGKVVVEVGPS